VLAKLYDEEGAMAADCASHLPELDRAISTVPVGIALWRGGELCARAAKDEAAAEFYGEAVSRLAAHALAKDRRGPWNPPIRVGRMAALCALGVGRGTGREVGVWMPPDVPVIIFSGLRSESADLETIRPLTRLVEKPYSLVMLMDTLEDMLEESKGNQSGFGRIAAS